MSYRDNMEAGYAGARGHAPQDVIPMPKSLADLNGHLINDHEYFGDTAGSSRPIKSELKKAHDWLHSQENPYGQGHQHSDDGPANAQRECFNCGSAIGPREKAYYTDGGSPTCSPNCQRQAVGD